MSERKPKGSVSRAVQIYYTAHIGKEIHVSEMTAAIPDHNPRSLMRATAELARSGYLRRVEYGVYMKPEHPEPPTGMRMVVVEFEPHEADEAADFVASLLSKLPDKIEVRMKERQ